MDSNLGFTMMGGGVMAYLFWRITYEQDIRTERRKRWKEKDIERRKKIWG